MTHQTVALDTQPGRAVYNRATLALYDRVVHGATNHWVWKCPTAELQALYSRHASSNHLDVGVGTGYFLDRHVFQGPRPRIGLMDLNQQALASTASRLARYKPERYVRDVLRPMPCRNQPFNSIGMTYLLHCLPGTLQEKQPVFGHLCNWLNDDGCLFGATVMGRGVERSPAAGALMAIYNDRGIFCNAQDDPTSLEAALGQYFAHVQLRLVGSVALFQASQPLRHNIGENA